MSDRQFIAWEIGLAFGLLAIVMLCGFLSSIPRRRAARREQGR